MHAGAGVALGARLLAAASQKDNAMTRDLSLARRLRIAGSLAVLWLGCLLLRARVFTLARRG